MTLNCRSGYIVSIVLVVFAVPVLAGRFLNHERLLEDLKQDEIREVQEFQEKERQDWQKYGKALHGKILNRIHIAHLPTSSPITLLDQGTEGEIVVGKILRSASISEEQPRLQILVNWTLGVESDQTTSHVEQLWVQYDPNYPPDLQPLRFLDANGNPISNENEICNAKKMRTLWAGVSAWPMQVGSPQIMCPQVSASAAKSLGKRTPAQAAQHVPSPSQVALVPGVQWDYNCTNFIDKEGNYGPWGQWIVNKNVPDQNSHMFSGHIGDMSQICPNYQSFNEDMRKNFWVWLAASVAMEESSCNQEIEVKGTYGIASGLLQLDRYHPYVYCDGACKDIRNINTLNGRLNVQCGLNMLNFYIGSQENSNNLVYWRGNYWQTLHPPQPGQRRVAALLRQFTPCRQSGTVTNN